MTQTLSVSLAAGTLYVSGTVNGVAKTWTNTDGNIWETTADRAEDDIYRIELTMIGSSGTTSTASLTLYYGILQLITDRTDTDVAEAKALISKLQKGEALTDEERTAYFAGLRGCYNASDMNRVGNAVRYIAGRLETERYRADVNPKLDWQLTDIVRQSDWNAYLNDVKTLRGIVAMLPTTPEITESMYSGINYIEANHIEQILVDLDFLITNIIAEYYYSGELYAGEV